MEEDKLQPLLDFEAQWEQELKTLKRKQAEAEAATAAARQARETAREAGGAMPMNPRELVEMMDWQAQQETATAATTTTEAAGTGTEPEAGMKEVVVTLSDEQKEWLATLPRRQCLLFSKHSHIASCPPHCTQAHGFVFCICVLCAVFVEEKQTLWTTWRRR